MIGPTNDDRAVSIAVTHVLTIGVTTVLVALLLTSSAGMLEMETDRSADQSLETIGERIAGEVSNVDTIAAETDENVSITAEHPRTVAGSGYTVELLDSEGCSDGPLVTNETDCLYLTSSGSAVEEYVPVKLDESVENSSAASGLIEIRYDGDDLSIRSGGQ